MSEPFVFQVQQARARDVSGDDLELMGKKAARLWSEGHVGTLSDAVIETVKQAHLSPEQVKRVIEFTNVNAYQMEFKKEGANHRYIDFGTGGPADPGTVLKDLNDGGGGSVMDDGRSTDDYHGPPPKVAHVEPEEWTKTASQFSEAELQNPYREAVDLRDRLDGIYKHSTSEFDRLSYEHGEFRERMYEHVKIAALYGHPLGEIASIFARVAPDEDYVKIAFDSFVDRLVEKQVFPSHEKLAESIEKQASNPGIPDPSHPLVQAFEGYCSTLYKLASLREYREELASTLSEMNTFLKEAAKEEAAKKKGKGVLETAWKYNKQIANKADVVGQELGDKLWRGAGKPLGKALKATAYVAPPLAAYSAYQNTLGNSPVFQRLKSTAMGLIPGTPEWDMKQYQSQMAMQGY